VTWQPSEPGSHCLTADPAALAAPTRRSRISRAQLVKVICLAAPVIAYLQPGMTLFERSRLAVLAAASPPSTSTPTVLALACDFRVFAESARVGLTETRYGILRDMCATVRLPRIVGESRGRKLNLLGDVTDAPEALRIGLASRVVKDEALASAAAELATSLASQPPLAVPGAAQSRSAVG
jgi:enoyl-CoA hydratase/carnithine racemase